MQAFYTPFYRFVLTLAIVNNRLFTTSYVTRTFCIFCLVTLAEIENVFCTVILLAKEQIWMITNSSEHQYIKAVLSFLPLGFGNNNTQP